MAKKNKIQFTERAVDVKKLRTLHEGGRSIEDLAIQFNMTKREIRDMLIGVLYENKDIINSAQAFKKSEVTLEQEAQSWDDAEPNEYFVDFEDDVDPSSWEDK
jgi:hypothetical protein